MPLAIRSLCLAAAVAAALPAAAAERRIAVLEFTARKVDPDLAEALAERARQGALAGASGSALAVMTRENTRVLVEQNGGACTEGECEVETGRLIGAALVLTGSASRFSGTWVVDLRLHETAQGRLVGATTVEAKDEIELLRGTDQAARALVAGAAPAPVVAPAAGAPPPAPAAPLAAAAAAPADPRFAPAGPVPPDAIAWLYVKEEGHSKEAEKHRAACVKGKPPNCVQLGVLYAKGDGVPHDKVRAVAASAHGCDLGQPVGCNNVGAFYWKGAARFGFTPDLAHAADWFARACRMGLEGACKQLAETRPGAR